MSSCAAGLAFGDGRPDSWLALSGRVPAAAGGHMQRGLGLKIMIDFMFF